MFQNRSFIGWCFRVVVSTILALILFISCPSPVLAQNNNPFQGILAGLQSLFASPTKKGKGAPVGRVRGGAGRGRCPAIADAGKDEIPLTALLPSPVNLNPLHKLEIPSKNSPYRIVWGRTSEAYPTFWFYIPYEYKKSELEQGKFVLLDEEDRIVSNGGTPIFVALSQVNKPSLAKFTLPNNEKSLEIDKKYKWFFSIICDEQKPSRNPSISGWIERVSLPVLPLNNYLYYARQNIWYDAVTQIADSYQSTIQTQSQTFSASIKKPVTVVSQSSIQEDWQNLLQSLNLDKISDAPIVELSVVSNN